MAHLTTPRSLTVTAEAWEFRKPFRITGHTFRSADIVHVTLSEGGHSGQGEAAGVYYLNETGEGMRLQIEAVRAEIEAGCGRQRLRELMPPGGARNAVDCALWDLEAKQAETSIWDLTGIEPGPTCTVLTIGIGTPEEMAESALALDSPRLKVKLNDEMPLERIRAVREARPDAEIIVDINQGWSFEQLVELAPRFGELDIAMIEQPLPRGGDEALEGYSPPVPLAADESCLCVSEFEQAARRYQIINIKLDKTGGLTEALELARLAEARDIDLMIGNMMGTSLAIAPAYVVAQLCRFIDLDGALFLTNDRPHALSYEHGMVSVPTPELWG
ncbi:N-acetyl-D-Glu racemase DgcA [Lentisalinibacter orientalis]|uniref:N-acetyl-D-Glu racemase DgcA n=1 Tax=Lentisalinibacter orientalis TaxID=2992241 RepID=UPI003866C4CA